MQTSSHHDLATDRPSDRPAHAYDDDHSTEHLSLVEQAVPEDS